ncbi:hypothetical protein BAZSYMA_ACONTIG03627_2 [Bathymodiolus azoricus thioautotrophic gill symbiont]|uniref:Uncharacterized protein n=1 Tax=Bathymodiolus azoricus thioautotrophic gill symbiont TaxID=235205 RepID=A0A1H6K6H9_9GAMM|nr:hypothetical protein BAZSYMA_ACONTIG03627_2 [Bathymodiolus azoricus thioautotrophic gill symbiont]
MNQQAVLIFTVPRGLILSKPPTQQPFYQTVAILILVAV